ncbi:MAG TPA: hypothetical protein GXX14_12995 [Clostridiaceae bacterium]|nr:hypothetical protein [Clostridiaceae bacterium]
MFKKRIIISIVLVVSLFIACFLPAYAQGNLTTYEKAEVLNKLSILTGMGDGDYKLSEPIKRGQAATFIVRIMGKEEYVLSNKERYSTTKFPDVISSQWYAPYVGYCSQNNIISGFEDGRFAPEDTINEQAFLKLMLEVLGYRNNIDYTWDTVYEKAYEIGLIDIETYDARYIKNRLYTRGDVVNILYNSLTLVNNVTNIRVIDTLINEGIVSPETAEELGFLEDSMETFIESVTPFGQNLITVYFNEEIEKPDDEDIEIYETNDITKSLTASVLSLTENQLIIQTSNQVPDRSYTIEFYNIRDKKGNVTSFLASAFKGYRNPNLQSDFFRISKVEPINRNVVNVYFTHPVNANSKIALYYDILEGESVFASGRNQDMIISTLNSVKNGVSIYLKSKSFTNGAEYRLEISGNLTSAYGVKLNEGEGDSISFEGRDDSGDEFKVTSVKAVGSNRVSIEFNREIDTNFAQKAVNYMVKGPNGLEIPVTKAIVSGEGDKKGRTVYLNLMYSLDKTKQYTVRFEYIMDIYKSSFLEEMEYAFSGAYPSNTLLYFTQVWTEDKGTVCIRFNKPLDLSMAENKVYYSIRGVTDTAYYAMPEKVYYDESNGQYVVKLYLPADRQMTSGHKYKVTVLKAMRDSFGESPAADLETTFTGSSNSNVKPVMNRAVIISRDSVKVEFSKEISAEIPNILVSNYTLQYVDGGVTISKLPVSLVYVDPKTLVLKFDSLDLYTEYTLSFDALKDYSGLYTRTASDGQNSIKVTVGQ